MPTLSCSACKKDCSILINGRCMTCNPFMACKKCGVGNYESKPIPSWMNRHICSYCQHKASK